MLIIKQMQGTWSCKCDRLASKLCEVKGLLRKIRYHQIHYVGRVSNQEADALASECLKEVMMEAVKFQEPKMQGWCKSCDVCQRTGPRRLIPDPQQPITSFGSFEKLGIDAIGWKEYIIVGMDYMTRWAEVAPPVRITAKDVAMFVFNNICCRFDTLLEIISDRGPGFRRDLVKKLMIKLGIKHRHSTPYYPQCNRLVEKVNGMICKIISKHGGSKTRHFF